MIKLIKNLMVTLFYSAGEDCPQCHRGRLLFTGRERHGDRILKCTNGNCGWEVRENT